VSKGEAFSLTHQGVNDERGGKGEIFYPFIPFHEICLREKVVQALSAGVTRSSGEPKSLRMEMTVDATLGVFDLFFGNAADDQGSSQGRGNISGSIRPRGIERGSSIGSPGDYLERKTLPFFGNRPAQGADNFAGLIDLGKEGEGDMEVFFDEIGPLQIEEIIPHFERVGNIGSPPLAGEVSYYVISSVEKVAHLGEEVRVIPLEPEDFTQGKGRVKTVAHFLAKLGGDTIDEGSFLLGAGIVIHDGGTNGFSRSIDRDHRTGSRVTSQGKECFSGITELQEAVHGFPDTLVDGCYPLSRVLFESRFLPVGGVESISFFGNHFPSEARDHASYPLGTEVYS